MTKRCAIYTRKSSDEGLEQAFNSLHAQREACEAYIKSQRHENWLPISTEYDDGGLSGGTMDRPALARLMQDIDKGKVDIVVVYKVDRLSRSLADFAKIVEAFDRQNASFVSVTQQFNTSNSMGRLTLNVLLSFAQFEREVTGERIRDKIAASKKKGMWMGGVVPLGYRVQDRQLVVVNDEVTLVKRIFDEYLILGGVRLLKERLEAQGLVGKFGRPLSRGSLYTILKNPIYKGAVAHYGQHHPGQHEAIIDPGLWDRVQAALASQHHNHTLRASAKDPGLLAGLIFDDQGYPMSPTHASKGPRRYRYYISQALLQYKEKYAGSVVRIAAREVEGPVVDALISLWMDPVRLLDTLPPLPFSVDDKQSLITSAQRLAEQWPGLKPVDQIQSLKKVLRRITISRDGINIELMRSALLSKLIEDQSDLASRLAADILARTSVSVEAYVIRIPAQLKRCGIETKLILGESTKPDAHDRTRLALQSALAKAIEWNQKLIDGEVASMAALAKQEGVTQRYIAHVLKLAYLAPDIMRAIFKGRIPYDFTLTRLKKGLPLDWAQQRKVLGISS